MAKLGFSLMSCVISISIFTVLISLTLTNISFLDQLLVRAELSTLYATCCYAQQVAQMSNEPCEIKFDAARGTYACDGRTHVLPKAVQFGVKNSVYGPPSQPQKLVTTPLTFKHACIRSTSDGMLSAGTVYLVDANKRYQYAVSSAIAQVPCVRCYRYDGAWHLLT